jgi:hypothetical protein
MLDNRGGASRLFQELCAPPVIKLLKMRGSLPDGGMSRQLTLILSRYAQVFQKMSIGKTNTTDLRLLDEALSEFGELFVGLHKICDEFGEMGKWVFDTGKIASVQREIISHLGKDG